MSNGSSRFKRFLSRSPKWAKVLGIMVLSFVVFLVAQFIGLTIVLALLGVNSSNIDSLMDGNAIAQFASIAFVELFTILGVVLLLNAAGRKLGILNWKMPSLKQILRILVYFAVYFFVTYIATIFIVLFVPAINADQAQQIGFEDAANTDLIWVFLALCVAAPIGEEVLFRGFLYRGVKKYSNIVIAAVITTVLFGIAHLEFGSGAPLNWIAAIDTALFSLALIYVYEKEKTIWAPIALHVLKNSLAFVFLFVLGL